MPTSAIKPRQSAIRVGEAAEVLGVSIDTLRRWESAGRLKVSRSKGGQRLVAMSEIRRLQTQRRPGNRERPIVAQPRPNRSPGLVTKPDRDPCAPVLAR